MKKTLHYNGLQMATLITLRMLIGWSSASFLGESQWILSGFSNWIISKPDVLKVADFLNIKGLKAIGAGLIPGLSCRFAAIAGPLLLLVCYFNKLSYIQPRSICN